MSYTQNGDKFIYAIKVENESSYTDTNVVTVIDPLPAGIVYDSHTNSQGTFVPGTLTWTIPSLPGRSITYLYLKVQVTNILNGPFTIAIESTGTLTDNDSGNNSTTLTVGPSACSPAGGGNADTGVYAIDVSLNDTKCTLGTTEWRLNVLSVTNGVMVSWDELTGQGLFTYQDPTLPITGTYDLWCVQGVDEFHVSCAVPFTIIPSLEDKDVFDHTISSVTYADLTLADIAVLTAQYPSLDLSDYCWILQKNADGDTTSGVGINCDDTADTKLMCFCSAVACTDNPCSDCPPGILPADVASQLPVGYVPQEGDVVHIEHTNAYSIYTYNGTAWIMTCGCTFRVSQDEDNLLTLGADGFPYISGLSIIDAIDEKTKVSANDTTSGYLNGKLVAGTGVTLTETNDGANETLVIAATGAGDDWGNGYINHLVGSIATGDGTALDPLFVPNIDVAVVDTSDVNLTLTGDGLMSAFTISATVNEGDPLPVYVSGTVGTGPFVVNCATLFNDTCPTGFTTATYTLVSYPADVYTAVSVSGTNLNYTILPTAPPGTHYINVSRSCS